MRRINIILDEETYNLLKGKKNMSRTVRDALEVYNSCVTLGSMTTIKEVLIAHGKLLKEIDSKLDYMNDNL